MKGDNIMFGGDDFDFVPDMDFDGDHDMMDVIIADQIFNDLQKEEEREEDEDWSIEDDNSWRDTVEEGYEYGVDPEDYDSEDDYLEALEEAKYAWRDNYEWDLDLNIDPDDYETEDEYLDALEEAKNEWKEGCEDGSLWGLDPDDYDNLDEYNEALNKAKYGWREGCENGTEYGLDPEDFETLEEYNNALDEEKYSWRKDSEEGLDYGIDPQDYETYEEYKEALEKEMYAWRDEADDGSAYGLDPEDFETEEDYDEALAEARVKEERRYSWRQYCTNRFGISAEGYETRMEYDQAIREAYEKEREEKRSAKLSDPNSLKMFKFCKVATDYPYKPFYYYFYGNLNIKIGDKVIVPFGQENRKTEGIVVSLGECYGCSFPCDVSNIKTVVEKVANFTLDDKERIKLFCNDTIEHSASGGWTRYRVDNIKIETDEKRAIISFIIEKTYDKSGASAVSNVNFKWRIVDQDGIVHKTGSTLFENLRPGDKRKWNFSVSNFETGNNYTLEFVSD